MYSNTICRLKLEIAFLKFAKQKWQPIRKADKTISVGDKCSLSSSVNIFGIAERGKQFINNLFFSFLLFSFFYPLRSESLRRLESMGSFNVFTDANKKYKITKITTKNIYEITKRR
jgi:hypothetical protein